LTFSEASGGLQEGKGRGTNLPSDKNVHKFHWPPQKQDHPYVYLIQVFNTVSEVFRVVFPPPMWHGNT
jgi:hypothetical protein